MVLQLFQRSKKSPSRENPSLRWDFTGFDFPWSDKVISQPQPPVEPNEKKISRRPQIWKAELTVIQLNCRNLIVNCAEIENVLRTNEVHLQRNYFCKGSGDTCFQTLSPISVAAQFFILGMSLKTDNFWILPLTKNGKRQFGKNAWKKDLKRVCIALLYRRTKPSERPKRKSSCCWGL